MASRGKNYSSRELKQLCYSVLHISQDPVVGAGQKSATFWERVTDDYEKNKPKGAEFRGRKSLEGKWSDVRHDTAKFVGVYSQVEDMQILGTNEADTIEKAKELFKVNHPKGKSFAYEECWAILKDFPKFCMPPDEQQKRKKSRISLGSKEQTSIANIEKENEDPNVNVEPSDVDENFSVGDTQILEFEQDTRRLMGTRKAKEKLKRAHADDSAQKLSARAQLELAAVGRDKVKVMQDNSLMQLLSLPCDSIELELRSFMLEWKMEEAKKLRGRMQGYNQVPHAPTQSPNVSPSSSTPQNPEPEIRMARPSETTPLRQPLTVNLGDEEEGTAAIPPEDINSMPLVEESLGTYGYGSGQIADLV